MQGRRLEKEGLPAHVNRTTIIITGSARVLDSGQYSNVVLVGMGVVASIWRKTRWEEEGKTHIPKHNFWVALHLEI